MSFPACLPEIAVSWPWTFSWQGRCHSFLQNYHHCKTWVIKSWFFFSTRNKMNLLNIVHWKKSLFWLLTKDIEESRAGGGVDQQSQEHNTRYMDQDLQVKIKVQVTQNLINGLKSMDRNVTDYDTIESETTGTCYSEHREHQIQVLLRWYAR